MKNMKNPRFCKIGEGMSLKIKLKQILYKKVT